MGIKITYLSPEAPVKQVKVDRRLWLTQDRTRLVEDGHPEAGFLFCAAGDAVPEDEFKKYELVGATAEPEEKAAEQSEDKALAGPVEDKSRKRRQRGRR